MSYLDPCADGGRDMTYLTGPWGGQNRMFEGPQPERGPHPPPNFMFDGHPQGPVGFLVSYAPALLKVETR